MFLIFLFSNIYKISVLKITELFGFVIDITFSYLYSLWEIGLPNIF
jgi:hypothetical protein